MIIGSTALKYHFPDLNREPHDLDIIVENSKNYKRESGVEYLENPVLLKYENNEYISPNMLLSLKISHMFWDINWDKHMYDIQFLLKKGCKYDLKIIDEFIEYWKSIKPKVRRSDLVLSKKDFFTNSINEHENEHDYLHTILNPIPMYTRLLKDNCEVELDESKWHNLTFDEKCDVVFEETSVMSWERYKNTHYRKGYKKQLKDNIIKHFPKYIAIFAIENYIVLEKPKYNYKIKIENELQKN